MTDGWRIYPAMLNAIIALRCLGYSETDPQVIRARDEFEKLGIEEPPSEAMPEPTFRMQPCRRPSGIRRRRLRLARRASPAPNPRMIKAPTGCSRKSPPQGRLGQQGAQYRASGWYFGVQQRVHPTPTTHRPGAAGC